MQARQHMPSFRFGPYLLLCAGTLLAAQAGVASAADTTATPVVDQRQAHQAQRIQQGVASGQLTQREARRLNRQQGAIAHAEAAAKADGVVTAAERRQLDHAQDRASAHIAHQKHDRQHRR